MAGHGLYDESPEIKRDEHGKMGVRKPMKKDEKEGKPEHLQVHEGGDEMKARHGMDRNLMHSKHEHEHAMHKGGSKHEMHERHEKEMKEMHTRHEKEAGATAGSHDVGEPIAKVEKGAKS